MHSLIPWVMFLVFLLAPFGTQPVFANHPQLNCDPPGILISNPTVATSTLFGSPFCFSAFSDPSCHDPGYSRDAISGSAGINIPACTQAPHLVEDPTHPDQCQNGAVLIGNHCEPDLNQICGQGTIIAGMQCIAQQMGNMVGGALLEIEKYSLFVAAFGVDPVITSLVGITLAGVTAQAAWFIHRKKNSNNG